MRYANENRLKSGYIPEERGDNCNDFVITCRQTGNIADAALDGVGGLGEGGRQGRGVDYISFISHVCGEVDL